jgi:hypothetical protein
MENCMTCFRNNLYISYQMPEIRVHLGKMESPTSSIFHVVHKIIIPSTMQLCLLITQRVSAISGHLQVSDAKTVTLHLCSLCVAVFLVNVV